MKRIQISNKLYGRKNEISCLLESFENISCGFGKVLLVPGYSGVGKTALVQELQNPVQDRNGFFVNGKFDQFQQNIPYFAFKQALTELCLKLQSEDKSQSLRFKENINKAIGNQGQVLIDFVPEFKSFLGSQPSLEEISPQEARHRFANVFRNFLKVICLPEHPLVLFLDDWQWADSASLELLKQIQIGLSVKYLLVIVSYRSNEVDSKHQLMTTVNDLHRQAIPIETLQVKNLKINDVEAILDDALMHEIEKPEKLVKIIFKKTLGNPFFVWSFLKFLFEFEIISFDKIQKSWKINLAKEGMPNLPKNIIELFAIKLHRIDPALQNLLSLAACLGNRFNIYNLSIISELDIDKCRLMLSTDQAKEIVKPMDPLMMNRDIKDNPESYSYIFIHDRLQQAAYSLIEIENLPHIHLKIGRLLLNRLQAKQLNERLYEVLNNLNKSLNLIQQKDEKLWIINLNITAARKAYKATAYTSALQFYQAACTFLEDPKFADYLWKEEHELAMNLHKERADCEFIEGHIFKAEKYLRQAINHSVNAIEKADVFNIFIVQYTLLARYPEAIQAARDALEVLGVILPDSDYENECTKEIALVRKKLEGRSISSLEKMPVMSNPEMLKVTKILITMGPPCYRFDQRLWSIMVPKVVNLILQYGNVPQLGYSHTAFGGLLAWMQNDYSTAKEFSKLATQLMTNKFKSPSDQSVFYLMIGSSNRHWFEHLKFGSQDYKNAYEIGLKSGNLQYAAYAFGHNMYCQFYQGFHLESLINDTKLSLEFSHSRHNQWAIDLLEGGLNIFGILSDEHFRLEKDDNWSEEGFLQKVHHHHNIQVTCIYKVLKTFSLLLFGKYEEALISSDEVEPLIYTVGTQGLLPWPEHVFARLLILTALFPSASIEKQTQWKDELDQIIKQLSVWAKNGKDNFKHKYLLAKAELAKIYGNTYEAIQLYDKAIIEANATGFLQWEGIANERAYHFWIDRGDELTAQGYWQKAYYCYSQWGAGAKVIAMEKAYTDQLAKNFSFEDESDKSKVKIKKKIIDEFLKGQILQIRKYVTNMQQLNLQDATSDHAKELENATQRLRVEIAERKKAEIHIKKSAERFERWKSSNFIGILHSSSEGGVVDANDALLNMLGYSKQELTKGKLDWTKLTPPEFLHLDQKAMEEAAEKGSWTPFEKEYFHKDGHRVPILIGGSVFMEAPNEYIVFIIDLSEQKKAAELLRESESRLRLSMNAAKAGSWTWEIETNNIIWDDRMQEIFGYTPGTYDGTYESWKKIVHPEDVDMADRLTTEAIKKGTDYNIEYRLNIKSNEEGWRTVRAQAIVVSNSKGERIRMVGYCEDITKRKLAEKKLNEALVKAEESDRLKSAFLSNMSHEIRTPMNGILGFTELLKEPKLSGDEQEKYINIIENSGHRLLNIINDLIDISKIEAGQMKVSIAEVDINNLSEQLLTFFTVEAKKKGVQLFLSTTLASQKAIFLSDQEKVYSILTNLIKNALKYTQEGTVDFGYHESGDELKFFVRDTGIGIAKERLEAIFDRFIRNDLHDDGVIEGSGLGLSISKAYVEMLGGKIWVESEEGVGSQFYFTIPYKAVRTEAEKNKEVVSVLTSDSQIKRLKILIAEDDEAADHLLTIIVKGISKEVLHVRSGTDAVKLCRSNPDIDLILMDIQMPEMNGYEATKQIREFNKDVIIIAQTAFALAGDREKSIEVGCDDYISKPIKKKELMAKIEKLVTLPNS